MEVHLTALPEPLAPERVRWFSYRAPLGSADEKGSIPHRGTLLRFAAADSAALEAAYRERRDDLDRCWWEEEAAQAKGSSASLASEASSSAAAAAAASGSAEAAAAAQAADTSSWAYFAGGCGKEDRPGVPVRSGAFEVDLRSRHLRPAYWPAHRHRVLRGTWFAEKSGEWVPLKEALAEQLEEGYRQALWLPARGRLAEQPGGGLAARLDLSAALEKGLFALFASEEEVWLCQETGWGWLRRIGASATAGCQRLRLRRGYEPPATKAALEKEADLRQEELDEASAAAPVSRLVLVVHGIGQKLEAANIAQDAASFRSVLRQVAAEQGQQGLLGEEGAAGRTEVLPVQWRKTLHIEADALSRQLMPPGIPSLRQVLHSTVVEVLLFMTPRHRGDIVASLVASLNATYARFLARNPGFTGTVSILAHSLGSVLCYDVLCNQPPPASLPPPAWPPPPSSAGGGTPGTPPGSGGRGGREPMVIDLTADSPGAALQQEVSRLRAENRRLQLELEAAQAGGGAAGLTAPPTLQFSVDRLILLGSPLGCFLALRGVNAARGAPLGSAAAAPLMQLAPGLPFMPDGLPAVNRLLNVYHPYDPVAHRLEPLAQPAGEVQRPAFVPLCKGGKRIHLAVQELHEDASSAASRLGTTLLSSLAFSKFKSSASFKKEGGSSDGAAAAAAAAEEAAEAAAEEAAARQLSAQAADQQQQEGQALGEGEVYASPSFGTLGAAASVPSSPAPRQSGGGSGGVARVADGTPVPGARTAQGRLDFVMQESSLENQYLSALSAHFAYWANADVALLVLRAVHGLDVLTGAPRQALPAIASPGAAVAAAVPVPVQGVAEAGSAEERASPREPAPALAL